MQRSVVGPGRPSLVHTNGHDYSKEHKPRQANKKRGRLSLNAIALLCGTLLLAAFMVVHFAGWGGQLLPDARGAGALEGLLQSAGAGRQRALTALEPIFKEWQTLQEEVRVLREAHREAAADAEEMRELFRQRVDTLSAKALADVTHGGNETAAADDPRRAWEAELRVSEDALSKAAAALELAEGREQAAMARVVERREEVKGLDGELSRLRLRQLSGSGLPKPPPVEASSAPAGIEEEESAQHLPNSDAADTVRDAVYQETGAREVQGDSAAQAGQHRRSRKEPRGSNLAQLQSAGKQREHDPSAWYSDAHGVRTVAEGWGGVLGADEADESVRCRRCGICEGASACRAGEGQDELGCLTDPGERQEAVREAARWSWSGYKKYAFGQDELLPLSKTSHTWFNLVRPIIQEGLTLVDSMDTLLLLGLEAEYAEAREWVATSLRTGPDVAVNLFETTIRVVGGLLAAFHLSGGDELLLFKAAELGLRLSPAFNTSTGIPMSDVNLATLQSDGPHWTADSSLAEITSLTLEFGALARASGEHEMEAKALHVVEQVLAMPGKLGGLPPIFINPQSGTFNRRTVTLGARGDSYYEYLLKAWIHSGRTNSLLLDGYREAMRAVRDGLLLRTEAGGLLYVAELHGAALHPKFDHLVCFLPGLLALGHEEGLNTGAEGEPDDLEVAQDLMHTCYELYRRTPTGLAPEIAFFVSSEASDAFPKRHAQDVGGGDFVVKDAHNLLRPETMESLFVLWRVTGQAQYREWAWAMFRAFHQHCRVESGGYANLDSVLQVPAVQRDKMESFWLAETLKYLYLILDESRPQLLPLSQYVFNTEAHPLPIRGEQSDFAAAKSYVKSPYSGLKNASLEERIEFWRIAASDAAASSNRQTW